MSRFYCFLKTIWYSLPQWVKGGYPIEGHSYYETYDGKDIQILKCMDCGNYLVGYYDGGEPLPPEKENIRGQR